VSWPGLSALRSEATTAGCGTSDDCPIEFCRTSPAILPTWLTDRGQARHYLWLQRDAGAVNSPGEGQPSIAAAQIRGFPKKPGLSQCSPAGGYQNASLPETDPLAPY
jgi:hypothetical protein